MNCPKCHKPSSCKDGIGQGWQRYLYKDCSYRYTVEKRKSTGDEAVKRQALELYLEGLGFRAIGRLLKFSNVTILNWIRSFGEQLREIRSEKTAQLMELDEMHTYIGSKKTVAGYGLLLIEMRKDSSIAYWAPGELTRERSFGDL